MEEITLNSHAKINLSLRITGRRDDGYHDIVSFMQGTGLHDVIKIKKCSRNATKYKLPHCRIGGVVVYLCTDAKTIPVDMSNLAFKGIKAFIEAYEAKSAAEGIPDALLIELDKRLPVAAGIAGGSGNAAVCMLGLNALMGSPLSLRELMDEGTGVGADVPFSIFMNAHRNRSGLTALRGISEAGDSAWIGGIGDIVEKTENIPCHVLLANHGAGVSTKAAYEAMDSIGYDARDAHKRELFVNDLEKYTLETEPGAAELKRIMQESLGAEHVLMSGSGPTIAAYYKDESKAGADMEKLTALTASMDGVRIWMTDSGM